MSIWLIVLLGIIQGATEFLPVSSSGHLVLAYKIFGVEENTILLSIVLHVATLFSVLVCYRKQILKLVLKPFCNTNKKLLVATIPTVLLALSFRKLVEESFSNNFIIVGFLITAIILFVSQIVQNKKQPNSCCFSTDITNLNVSYFQSFLIGVSQGFAVFPGISRSGSTIACGLLCGVDKNEVADFSFLLSIPIILGSMFFELIKIFKGTSSTSIPIFNLMLGFIASFLVGVLCINLMLKLLKNKKMSWFSLYLVLISVFLILNKCCFGLF